MPKGIYVRTQKTRKSLSVARMGKVPWNKGIPWTKETREKQLLIQNLLAKREEKSPEWKGEKVGYYRLHAWITEKLGRPGTCEHCGKTGLRGRKIHWANKDGRYKRNLTDWIRLCVPCHKKYDCPPKKQCKNGHKFIGKNLIIYNNTRLCRTCKLDRLRKWRKNNLKKHG